MELDCYFKEIILDCCVIFGFVTSCLSLSDESQILMLTAGGEEEEENGSTPTSLRREGYVTSREGGRPE